MVGTALLSLIVNAYVIQTLSRFRRGEVHLRVCWLRHWLLRHTRSHRDTYQRASRTRHWAFQVRGNGDTMTLPTNARGRRMPRPTALLVLAAAGCNGQGGDGRTPAQTQTQTATVERANSTATAPSAVGLSVGRSAAHGAYLTDRAGRALYLLEAKRAAGGGCDDRCLAIWPPLYSGQAAPLPADSGLDDRSVGTIGRAGGLQQVTYRGHPLYYYLGDGGPGQTLGHHVEDSWGEWYLVSSAGGRVRAPDERGGGDRRREER